MPKIKVDDDELDIDELEEAEYSEDDDFAPYGGDIPPVGTILGGYVKKMWWTYTKNDDRMLKVLWVAEENPGKLEEYNGLPVWLNAPLIPSAKFRWAPFLNCFGITLRDIKTKLFVEENDDETMGAPIEKIGSWAPGTDAAWCRIVTGRERFQGEWQPRATKWLEWEEPGEAEEPEEELEVAEEEPEEEAPPARGRRAAKAPAAKAPARGSAGRSAAKAPAAKASAPARRGGRRAAGKGDEPPF